MAHWEGAGRHVAERDGVTTLPRMDSIASPNRHSELKVSSGGARLSELVARRGMLLIVIAALFFVGAMVLATSIVSP